MIANDLRIGNYVEETLFTNRITQITSISQKRVHVKYEFSRASVSIKDITPITLTEEILLKCGFEKSNDLDKFYHLDLLNEWTRIYFNPKHNICQLSINQHDSCIRIKYLHELQNLVFALTQKELQIEL